MDIVKRYFYLTQRQINAYGGIEKIQEFFKGYLYEVEIVIIPNTVQQEHQD